MVEMIIALGVGIVLAFLLASPGKAAQRTPRPTPTAGVDVRPTVPLLAAPLVPSAATPAGPSETAPRKATQTAHRFK